jgi:hypothetical protein
MGIRQDIDAMRFKIAEVDTDGKPLVGARGQKIAKRTLAFIRGGSYYDKPLYRQIISLYLDGYTEVDALAQAVGRKPNTVRQLRDAGLREASRKLGAGFFRDFLNGGSAWDACERALDACENTGREDLSDLFDPYMLQEIRFRAGNTPVSESMSHVEAIAGMQLLADARKSVFLAALEKVPPVQLAFALKLLEGEIGSSSQIEDYRAFIKSAPKQA